jgi:hypothetical protein
MICPPRTRFWSECENLGYVRLVLDTRLWKWFKAVLPIYGTACATMSYELCNHVLQIVQPCLTAYGNGLKQFFPSMELLVQLCLTIVQPCLTAYGNGLKQFSPFMELLVQPCLTIVQLRLTAYGNG